MALKNLQAEVDKLFEITFGQLVTSKKTGKTKSKATYKLRKVLGANTIECTVEAKHIQKTLFDQWTYQNTDAPGDIQAEAKAKFKKYGVAVIEEFNQENRIQKARQAGKEGGYTYHYRNGFLELHVYTNDMIKFSIGGFGRNDISFLNMNKQASKRAMQRKEFEGLFASERVADVAEVAHKKGYSIVEAKGDILGTRAGQLMGPQGLKEGQMGPEDPDSFEDYGIDTSKIGNIGGKLQELQNWRTTTSLKGSNDLKVSMRQGKIVSTTKFKAQVEAKWQNRQDAQQQSALGNQLKTLITDLQAEIKKQHDSAEEGSKEQMSRAMIDVVGDMIVMTPTKRRMYAKRKAFNRSKYNVIPRSKAEQTATKEGSVTRKRQSIKAGGPDNSIRVPANQEKGKGQGMENYAFDMKHLLKVKNAINRRLPAQVRRNMKRPALVNRSGRFSNSVRVDSVLPAAQTLMVKYNYRLDPYETFENTGKKRWPRGYNPKPLISKSIRELALGLVDQKLTIRRA